MMHLGWSSVSRVHSPPKNMFEKLNSSIMDLTESMDSSTIRVDKNSHKGSVMDTIRMVLKCNSGAANTYLSRLLSISPELTTHCGRLKINGKGNETPVADAKTLIQIVWLLLAKKYMRFVPAARR